MTNEQKWKETLLAIANDSTKEWTTKPEFEVVCESLGCMLIAHINNEKRVKIAAFKRAELDDCLNGSCHAVRTKIEARLLQLQREFSY